MRLSITQSLHDAHAAIKTCPACRRDWPAGVSVLPRGQRPGDSVADAANDTSPDWGLTFFNVTHLRIGAVGMGGLVLICLLAGAQPHN